MELLSADDGAANEVSETGETDEISDTETGEAGVVSDGSAEAESTAEESDGESEDESQPTVTPKPEKKETKKKWFSTTIFFCFVICCKHLCLSQLNHYIILKMICQHTFLLFGFTKDVIPRNNH